MNKQVSPLQALALIDRAKTSWTQKQINRLEFLMDSEEYKPKDLAFLADIIWNHDGFDGYSLNQLAQRFKENSVSTIILRAYFLG